MKPPNDALIDLAAQALALACRPGADDAAQQRVVDLVLSIKTEDPEELLQAVLARFEERLVSAIERRAPEFVGLQDVEQAERAVLDLIASAAQVN